MKILQVVCYFYPSFAYGGTSRYVYEISKAMAKLGHQITVFTTDALDKDNRITKNYEFVDGIEIRRFRNMSNYIAYRHKVFISPDMVYAIKNELTEYDAVHLNDFRTLQNLIVHDYAIKYDIPYILQAHGSLVNILAKQKLKYLYDILGGRRIIKDASRLVAFTKLEVEQYKNYGVNTRRIDIIPNGIDLDAFDKLPLRGSFRKKYGFSDGCKVILFLGRIHKIKGIGLLINAFADIAKKRDDVYLVITGADDGYLSEVESLIENQRLQNKVIFTGALYGKDKLAVYADADVYVLPSLYEMFPTTILEAMACGLPVITTDRCGIADVIENKTGLIVSYEKEQLAQAICRLLDEEKLRQRFGENGRVLVREQYSWDNIAKQMEKVYQKNILKN